MCVSFWLLDQHPAFWLILALNRDEYLSRPTRAAHFWEGEAEEDHSILGGRDVLGGGTWMGVTKRGRIAFLTNVRDKTYQDLPGCTSRGDLPTRFFRSHKTPLEFLDEIALESDHYNGFNLVVADLNEGEMAFFSNRHGRARAVEPRASSVQKVSPGLHSLSNGTLDSQWPKMERGKTLMESILSDLSPDANIPNEQIVEKILSDRTKADDVSVQQADTSYPEDIEKSFSPIFISTSMWKRAYGTRSMVVVGIRRDGHVSFFERYLEGNEWKDHSFQFQVQRHS